MPNIKDPVEKNNNPGLSNPFSASGVPKSVAKEHEGTGGGRGPSLFDDSSGSSGAKNSSDHLIATPSLSLPKGGGAIRGIGEKFSVNPANGTASLSVPIYASPGRSGFGPQLSLSYDSGNGNGPFGIGWTLSIPSITRKTDKGIPKYEDGEHEDSDEYILAGAEDLVPVLVKDSNGQWHKQVVRQWIGNSEYHIQQYRPRVEGLFSRIERWTESRTGRIHWRTISKENTITYFGRTASSCIADPSNTELRIFSWLISESYDDKGNAISYEYKSENSQNVDPTLVSEKNRSSEVRATNKYIKKIQYGNRWPYDRSSGRRENAEDDFFLQGADWMFEVLFDYGEGHYVEDSETSQPAEVHLELADESGNSKKWPARRDPFSTYRAGFEIRNYRLCRRILVFHHFPQELGLQDYLVKSTEFRYTENEKGSFITSITQSGFVYRPAEGRYLKKSMPPLEFEYSQAKISDQVGEIYDPETSLENLPVGISNNSSESYQWVDLDGEGLPGILSKQDGAWFYKRNLGSLGMPDEGNPERNREDDGSRVRTSSDSDTKTNLYARLGPLEEIGKIPSQGGFQAGRANKQQLLDLDGNGKLDLVNFDKASPYLLPGYYERTATEWEGSGDGNSGWQSFVPFASIPNVNWNDPNLRMIDLTGDGLADILITEAEAFTWYPSIGKSGFGPSAKVWSASLDEEKGPRLIFADSSQSIFLSDMSGDGLVDLVRIRNGEVCYWPNLGYGRFGNKVTMDNYPHFDFPDQFDQRRIRLADVDGSGTTDIVYLKSDGSVSIYYNQSGNSWSDAYKLENFPPVDNLSSVDVVDLLGNGTACIVWSSPLPKDSRRPIHFIDLMGGQKPHLLVLCRNNLGAETRIRYAPSTKFYLADKFSGKPWITRIPFPVHVVERVEIYDWISRNRFAVRYSYHHGYYDGVEREFRGFGMVEQWDTEEYATLANSDNTFLQSSATNIELASHVPPVLTKTWFHTGAFFEIDGICRQYEKEYYREPGLSDQQFRARILPDTVLPEEHLTPDEAREACRALKGSVLRQEVFALDKSPKSTLPYTVTENSYSVNLIQGKDRSSKNRHAVFYPHPHESISYHYERNPADPRISHSLTLEVDSFGNLLKQADVGYGRRRPDPDLPLDVDRAKQTQRLVTYTENRVTNAILAEDDYRAPLPCEIRTFELTGYSPHDTAGRFRHEDFVYLDNTTRSLALAFDSEVNYEDAPTGGRQRRLIEHVRTLYRKNDLTALLQLGMIESLALPGETYKLAFTPGLLARVYQRPRSGIPPEDLLPNPASILGGQDGDRGGYVQSQELKLSGYFPSTDGDGYWWVPSGRLFYLPESEDIASQERAFALQHFFTPRRYRNPFRHTSSVTMDSYDYLMEEIVDPVDNSVRARNDYRVLQPWLVTDPNRNRSEVAFDALGMVVGTAVMGKEGNNEGDSLIGFEPDLTEDELNRLIEAPDPHTVAPDLLGQATSRIIYDISSFYKSRQMHAEDAAQWHPNYAASLVRETHASAPLPPSGLRIQVSFSYSDGFGQEIQKKSEGAPLVRGGREISPRWIGSGWTIFNNKGKPVRQYEPFFSPSREFEFASIVGVSSVLFYDPVGRVVATIYPNQTYEKVVFSPWQQMSYDANDTVAPYGSASGDPRTDADIQGYVAEYFNMQLEGWQTWYEQRISGAKGPHEKSAAEKAEKHANTPSLTYFDSLGRSFLSIAHNRYDLERRGGISETVEEKYATRVKLDIEGNQKEVRDAVVQNDDMQGRVVMRYDYDMLGNIIHQISMDAGNRWMLNDVAGKSIHAWDDRGHAFRTEYDSLRRPLCSYVKDTNSANPDEELLTERLIYGEQHPEDELRNLRGALYLHFDQAGVVTNEVFDFKGNLLRSSRRLAREYKRTVDWRILVDTDLHLTPLSKIDLARLEIRIAPVLETETFNSRISYDALNRQVQLIVPHSNRRGTAFNVVQPVYNEANLVKRIRTWLGHREEPARLLNEATDAPSPVGVNHIEYNAKGQRRRIDYGNGATTIYEYDPLTFRLVLIFTLRNDDRSISNDANRLTLRDTDRFKGDCPKPTPAGWPGCHVQNLRYFYDPVGNITHVQDDAQQSIFFRNRRIEPSTEYVYDAIYRLIKAEGREHLGQVGGASGPHSYNDAYRVGIEWSANDGNAMGTYIERYMYDAVGNFISMHHGSSDPAHPCWTRRYAYNEPSLVEPAKMGNRLSSTTVGNNNPITEPYLYDSHGNSIHMPHLAGSTHLSAANMYWDHKDQLQLTKMSGGGRAYYVYNATGQRVRKVWEKAPGLTEERIYLGSLEIFRRSNRTGIITLERETLHIMNNNQPIASIETRTLDIAERDRAPPRLVRYRFTNHLGSVTMELDHEAEIISYEEYSPYGSTVYQAVSSQVDTPKRYRFAGKEREEETGMYYYGARYHAPWLARWISSDPKGLVDGVNLYVFCLDNPVRYDDSEGTQSHHPRQPESLQPASLSWAIEAGFYTPLPSRQSDTTTRPSNQNLTRATLEAVSSGLAVDTLGALSQWHFPGYRGGSLALLFAIFKSGNYAYSNHTSLATPSGQGWVTPFSLTSGTLSVVSSASEVIGDWALSQWFTVAARYLQNPNTTTLGHMNFLYDLHTRASVWAPRLNFGSNLLSLPLSAYQFHRGYTLFRGFDTLDYTPIDNLVGGGAGIASSLLTMGGLASGGSLSAGTFGATVTSLGTLSAGTIAVGMGAVLSAGASGYAFGSALNNLVERMSQSYWRERMNTQSSMVCYGGNCWIQSERLR